MPAFSGRGPGESSVKILLGRWEKPTWRAAFALLAAAWMVSAGSVAPASAQDGPGLRAGLSANPDQFFFGGHYVTKPIWDQMRFQPNVEAGFGDGLTVVAFNVEFAYWMPIGADWHAYVRRRSGAESLQRQWEGPRRGCGTGPDDPRGVPAARRPVLRDEGGRVRQPRLQAGRRLHVQMTGLSTRWAPACVGTAVLRVSGVLCETIGRRLEANAVNGVLRRPR